MDRLVLRCWIDYRLLSFVCVCVCVCGWISNKNTCGLNKLSHDFDTMD